MPNWPIGVNIKEHMLRNACIYSARRVSLAEADFPLTVQQIQDALMPREDSDTLMRYKNYACVSASNTLTLNLGAVRGVSRAALVELRLPNPVVCMKPDTFYRPSGPDLKPDQDHHARPDWSHLDDETHAKLTAWTNGVIRERRLEYISNRIVVVMLAYCPTVAHVMRRWPILATLAEGNKDWVNRFRNAPARLEAYEWPTRPDANVMQYWEKEIKAAEVVLTSGAMLDTYQHPDGVVRASIPCWQTLPHDREKRLTGG